MTMRADERAQLHHVLRTTLQECHGTVPTPLRRSLTVAHGISKSQMYREIATVRSGCETTTAQGWWTDEASYDHVLTALAATDNVKQAWRRLRQDGTVHSSYPQFTRQLRQHLSPAVRAALVGNGREDYLANSLYCTDQVPHRNVRWQADGQEIPVWVQPDRAGAAPFKPWQVTFIDDATRMVMATVITATRPSTQDVLAALATAVRGFHAPDGTFVGGLPDTIRWDNGGEFLNDAVTLACAQLGISPRPASPYAGWHKGKIERWHETIQSEVYSELPGASDGPTSFTGRQPWRGEDDRLLSFSALTLHALEGIRAYNFDRRHSSLGSTPLEAWRGDTTPVRFAAPQLLHPLMVPMKRQYLVHKDGISYKDVKYTSPDLKNFKGSKVNVRVLPHDYDTIAVFDGDTFICEAVRAANLSSEARRLLVRQRHEDYRQIKAATQRAAARRAQDAVIRGLTDPAPAQPQRPAAGPQDLLPDEDALLALLGDDTP